MSISVNIYQEMSARSGYSSLILHITSNGIRTKKALGLRFKTNPQSEAEKRDKKEKWLMATKIANEQEKHLLTGVHSLQGEYELTKDFIAYAENFITYHEVKDKRKYQAVIKKLKAFTGREKIPCFEITEILLQRFVKRLQNELKGESPHNYFSKLKQIITAATSELYFQKNPAATIRVKKTIYLQKEILTVEEVQLLYSTPVPNLAVRNAFLLTCLTGLRWVDIKQLSWKHITENAIKIIQAKTEMLVTIPLHDDARTLLGERGQSHQLVFSLPSHTGALKLLKNWTTKAGINKHITWHCGRHGFASTLIASGVDVSITSKLLGHTNLTNTQRYVRISEILKEEAIHKLPLISKPK